MKILHLCGDLPDEGAATGVFNLHKELLEQGVDSRILFARGEVSVGRKGAQTFYQNKFINALAGKLFHRLEPLIILLLRRKIVIPFSLGIIGYPRLLENKLIKEADVIHLHWINAGFVNLRQIDQLAKPLVWTIRDEWPYTGGCHYAGDCRRFEQACGICPMLCSTKNMDLSRRVHQRKAILLKEKRIRFVAISRWIRNRAKGSWLLKDCDVEIISNGIDRRHFKTEGVSRDECRKALGLPLGVKLILAGAQNLDSPYKGYAVLQKFMPVESIPYRIVTFGSVSKEFKSLLNVPSIHLGKISQLAELKKIYQACDVFLAPSRMEAFGKTLAEASAAGLPVVAYNYGGPVDIVKNLITGILVEPFDEERFVQSTLELLWNDELRLKMGQEAELLAKELFDSNKLCREYIEIYREEIGRAV